MASGTQLIAKNKKAFFDYEILETIEAGIVLTGPEIKSVRAGHMNLKGSFVTMHHGEVFLTNAHISPYAPAARNNTEPTRSRKLLLKRSEITRLIGQLETEGITSVPLEVYLKNNRAKVLIGIVRGKKRFDKRRTIKERESRREVDRVMKSRS